MKNYEDYKNIPGSGFVPDDKDKRDAQYEMVYGADSVIESPKAFSWKESQPDVFSMLPFQDGVNSCVTCTASFIQTFNSVREGRVKLDKALSWPFLYALAPHYAGGTKPREVFQILRKIGISRDEYAPEIEIVEIDTDRETKAQDQSWIDPQAYRDAETFRIKNFSFLDAEDREWMKRAVLKMPLALGIYVDWHEWKRPGVIKPGRKQGGHMVTLTGWNASGDWEVANWHGENWQDQGVGYLDAEYPFEEVVSFRDLPDNWKELNQRSECKIKKWFQKFYGRY